MSGSTTHYGLVYPTAGDPVYQGAAQMQALAEDIDDLMFSNGVVFNGKVSKSGDDMSGTLTRTGTATGFTAFLNAVTTIAYAAQVATEGFFRFIVQIDGKLGWGPGNVTRDTFLERIGVNQLKASGQIIDGTPIVSNAAPGTLSADQKYWVFNGTTATWTLPAVAGNTGCELVVKNRGSGTLTVQRAGLNQIYDTSAVTSVAVAAGGVARFVNDGTYWLKI